MTQGKENGKVGEEQAACEDPSEQARWFFQTGSSSCISTKKRWQDCTCYLKPPPFQFYNMSTETVSSTIPHCVRTLLEIANATHTREMANLTCLCRWLEWSDFFSIALEAKDIPDKLGIVWERTYLCLKISRIQLQSINQFKKRIVLGEFSFSCS